MFLCALCCPDFIESEKSNFVSLHETQCVANVYLYLGLWNIIAMETRISMSLIWVSVSLSIHNF